MKKACQLTLALYCLAQYSIAMGTPIIHGDYTAEIYMEEVPSTDHLSFDSQGNLYTGREDFANEYLKINRVSKDLKHSAFGPAIYDPDAVIVDRQGYLSTYGPDSVLVAGLPGQITQISPDGSQSSVLYRYIGKNPQQMVFDQVGRLLYVDCFSKSLGVISGGSPSTLASFGRATCPAGVAVDSLDNIYVSDYFGDNLTKLSSDGTVLDADFATGFSRPDTLAYDFSGAFGNLLYVASRFDGLIHTINTETREKKLFASGFNTMYGLTFGPDNCLYGSEMREDRIWKICPNTTQLLIDIKPEDANNVINPKNRGKLPVAILGSRYLNVFDLNLHSATFGVTGNEESFAHYSHSTHSDFNDDGYTDIMMYFYTQSTGVNRGTEELFLNIEKLSGQIVQGSDMVSISGNKKDKGTVDLLGKSHPPAQLTTSTAKTVTTTAEPKEYQASYQAPLQKKRSYAWINFTLPSTQPYVELISPAKDRAINNTPDNLEPSYPEAAYEETAEPASLAPSQTEAEIELTQCEHAGELDHFDHGDKPCPFEYGDLPRHCKHHQKISLFNPL